MTTFTGTDDFGVINKGHRLPDISTMAGLAIIGGVDVCRRVFARGAGTVVTGQTGFRRGTMIKRCDGPRCSFMTTVTS